MKCKAKKQDSKGRQEECDGSERTCFHCLFGIPASKGQTFRGLMARWTASMSCFNHPESPGEHRDVWPTGTCRNFRPRRAAPVRGEPPEPPNEEIRYIPLTRGKFAIVDAADYERLSKYRWNACPSGDGFYARRSVPGGTILMHREVIGAPKGMPVDHINGNRADNRAANLRVCTPQQNEHNKPPRGGRSRYKGVYPHRDKWQAAIKHNGKTHYLGVFEDEIEAAKARDRKAVELQGEFAYLNFPEEAGG